MENGENLPLIQLLNSVIQIVAEDIGVGFASSDIGAKAFEDYTQSLSFCLDRYHHHQGTSLEKSSLQSRFLRETAILHVATYILKKLNEYPANLAWPIENEFSFYSWYTWSQGPQPLTDNLLQLFKRISEPQLVLIEACDQLLSQTEERFIGEFYTPPSIVNHLIEISGFQPDHAFSGSKLVDPACGGGMILAKIAHSIISHGVSSGIPSQEILTILTKNVYGYDIQPFAVTLCRTALFSLASHLIQSTPEYKIDGSFSNIALLDPLANSTEFWRFPEFDYVIGNPPFMSVKKSFIDYINVYDEVVYGHPNLYVLFLWWSVKAAKPNARIALLLPQSMLAGNYFQLLRERLAQTTRLLSLTRMIDRTGVVGNVDQQMMAVCLQVTKDNSDKALVELRVTRNGADINSTSPLQVSHEQVIQNVNSSTIWLVSEDHLDYEIEHRLRESATHLGEHENLFRLGNGGFVWNQKKDLLRSEQEENCIPLVSAASVSIFDFQFPYSGPHPTRHRPFSKVTDELSSLVKSGQLIFLQRTTPRKVGRRLVCCIPSEDFLSQYPSYFLENHVNYISSSHDSSSKLFGLLGWLNSDLINFVFQLRNGTTHASIYELHLLPVDLEVVSKLSKIAMLISSASASHEQTEFLQELNEVTYDSYHLNNKHRQRIRSVLTRHERKP